MHTVLVRHNFETAHRLPYLGGKCANLHGHSWWAELVVGCRALGSTQTVVEFGALKKSMRQWIDSHLDHGAMLGVDDPLTTVLAELGSKVFVFGVDWKGSAWPTVEAVAMMIGNQAASWIDQAIEPARTPSDLAVVRTRVTETHVNSAEWLAP